MSDLFRNNIVGSVSCTRKKMQFITIFLHTSIHSGGDGGSNGGASGGGIYIEANVAKIGGMYL